jgi:transcriptional regulator with XRE-family HTH domain
MTHLQRVFIQNLRFFRNEKKLSQMKLAELIEVTPNYLNAVENGKNFPSAEVLQRIVNVLEVLPYQLFLEYPGELIIKKHDKENLLLQELTYLKQQFCWEIDKVIQKYQQRKE